MKNNETLQREVQDAIKWEPLLHAAEIGVIVKNGVVTLTGTVDSYMKKVEAEVATKNIAGVKAVVENIKIVSNSAWAKKTDEDIANEVLTAYKWNVEVPNDKIHVKVENGKVTLDGDVSWNYQKEAAEHAIKSLSGVMGVINNIHIKSSTQDSVEKAAIEKALASNWALNNGDITVHVNHNKVTLVGMVNSWYQKNEAGKIAWKAPGVTNVENDLLVEFEYSLIS